MRLIRPGHSWRVIGTRWTGSSVCLQRLALRCGYNLTAMGDALECKQRYLHEVFMRDLGLPPKAWLRRERMVVARRMLTGGEAVAEVAAKLGFSCVDSFRREFVAHHRVVPSKYQRDVSGGQAGQMPPFP